ncbi:ESPR-type extended signal peptide-containing protein [Dyella koreensis]|uniref:YadA-like family protein n=1 Tax=Dyella koreensis TaxID=311235 RepID=A0ABW8K9R0_9GAMM
MNTIYRIVWNAATNKWIVASELAKGRKKGSTKSAASLMLLAGMVGGLGLAHQAEAATTTLNPTATASCGTPANGALLNPAWTDGTSLCGTAVGEAAVGFQGGSAFGDHASTSGFYGVALGAYSSAASHATAVGPSAMALGSDSFAGGVNATANGTASVAIGNRAATQQAYATAAGNNALALTNSSVAMGSNATAGSVDGSGNPIGANQIALGMGTLALADRSVALGAGATVDASAAYGMAMGRTAHVTATGVNAVALGQASVADRADTVSVGAVGSERQVVNVAAGTQNTDAVNLSQLKNTAQSVAGALGGSSTVNADGTITAPSYTVADLRNGGNKTVNSVGDALTQLNANTTNLDGRVTTNTNDIAQIRRYSKVNGTVASSATGANTIAIGNGAQSNVAGTADGNIAIGSNAKNQNTGAGAIVMGRNATIQGTGGNAAVTGAGSIALGDNANIYGNNSIAIGANARATHSGDIAVGGGAAVTGNSSIAFGINASASADNAIALGASAVANRNNTLSVGSATSTRQVVNVMAGTQSTDAVNLGQLSPVVSALGGTVNANGSITTPTYTVQGTGYRDVAKAFEAIDGNVTSIRTDITGLDQRVTVNESNVTNLMEGKVGLVQQADANAAVTVAAATGGSAVNFAGTAGDRQLKGVAAGTADNDAVNVAQLKSAGLIGDSGDVANVVTYDSAAKNAVTLGGSAASVPVALKNVASGELSSTSTDAVNGSQLYATNQQVAKNTGDITTINNQLGKVVANNKYIDIKSGTWSSDVAASAGNGSMAIGANAQAPGMSSVALGGNTRATGGDSTAVGRGAQSAMQGTAVGASTRANNTAATAIGFRADASGVGSTATGYGAVASGDRAVAMGSGATASGDNSLALGRLSTASNNNAVALGQGSATDRDNSVSVGSAGKERQITNVADGTEETDAVNLRQLKKSGLVASDGSTMDAVVYDAGSNRGQITFGGMNGTLLTNVAPGRIANGSMDAVNGSQLWGVQDQINKMGDRVTNVENTLVQPIAPVDPVNPVNPVAQDPHFASNGDADKSAVATGASSVAAGENAQATGANSTAAGAGSIASGNNSVATGSGAQATASNAVALGNNSVADRADTVSVGSVGGERQIANVAAGTQRTDAANFGQLQDAVSGVQNWASDRFDGLSKKLNDNQRQANRGIAASAALVNNMPYLPGKTTLNAGVAAYRGQSALGVGMSRWNDSGRFNVNAGVSAARGDAPIFRVGVGVVLGD